MSQRLFNLLRDRMADERVGLHEPVTIAELHKRLLPYHTCRDALQFATKAEYDGEMLELLADGNRVEVTESGLAAAVLEESRQAEPGLGFLQRFAASEIRLRDSDPPAAAQPDSPGVAETGTDAAQAAIEGCRACGYPLPRIEGARYCPSCGTDQVIPTCSECEAELDEDWRYCALCGILVDRDN
ncbi:MAG: zinc ribbon domain-containing protein [Gemmatimonadota bacterium]